MLLLLSLLVLQLCLSNCYYYCHYYYYDLRASGAPANARPVGGRRTDLLPVMIMIVYSSSSSSSTTTTNDTYYYTIDNVHLSIIYHNHYYKIEYTCASKRPDHLRRDLVVGCLSRDTGIPAPTWTARQAGRRRRRRRLRTSTQTLKARLLLRLPLVFLSP